MKRILAFFFALLLAFGALGAENNQFRIKPADDAWRAALPHDADAATQAYMDRLPKETLERSNAYFEGGYWLILWNFLAGLLVAWVLLAGKRTARVRDRARRIGRKAFVADAVVGLWWWLASTVLTFPLTVYQFYFREHQYGMATQTFGPWLAEQLVSLAVGCVVVAIVTPVVFALVRRTGRYWWITGAALAFVFQVIALLVAPVWIDPLFNTYKPVQDVAVKDSVLAMAHADGVPAENIYEVDASRQTTRVSANVSGILGSAQLRLNDNLLRTSLPEIRGVMGHELGHYVMNHEYELTIDFSLLLVAGFALTAWIAHACLARWGERWSVQGVGDVASLPLLAAALSVFFFLATPLFNTVVRVHEIEADRFGINLSREPLGFAEVALKLTEYRKPDPGPIEEFIFFDHPGTRFRVKEAMQWREAMHADGPDKPWPPAK